MSNHLNVFFKGHERWHFIINSLNTGKFYILLFDFQDLLGEWLAPEGRGREG